MALVECPECSTEVSSLAAACPKCAYPIAKSVRENPGKGRFDSVAATAGVDLSQYQSPRTSALSDTQVTVLLAQKKKTNHILHLLLSLVTGGLWLIVWLLVADSNKRHNRRIDERVG